MTGEPVTTNEIAQVVGPCWSEPKVLAALGVTADTVASRREAGTILALPTADGARVYPVDQFRRHDGTVEVKPALLPLLRALRRFDPVGGGGAVAYSGARARRGDTTCMAVRWRRAGGRSPTWGGGGARVGCWRGSRLTCLGPSRRSHRGIGRCLTLLDAARPFHTGFSCRGSWRPRPPLPGAPRPGRRRDGGG